ncbi:hypothetical protein FGB62_96g112 [Gracilaria domingensis]|nr:hypothetical protein FGB62_96g112 [Gracilaria domingensis]
MDAAQNPQAPLSIVDVLVKLMNAIFFLRHRQHRNLINFRWANSFRDAFEFAKEFAGGQYTVVYGRITSRYKYHAQQRFQNAIRKFDVANQLRDQLEETGNLSFYKALLGQSNLSGRPDFKTDLTRIADLDTTTTSGDYVYRDVLSRKGQKAAMVARQYYIRGFSRVVDAMDDLDWNNFRSEFRHHRHLGADVEESPGDKVLLIAVSYKGESVEVTRRMKFINEDGTSKEGEEGALAQFEIDMTSKFVDDFRWSQLIRTCKEIVKKKGTHRIRLWIDKFMMMGRSKEEIRSVYEIVNWTDIGLFAYAVCPVVRLYDKGEPLYGTDFWRKLEAVLGVAGRGIVVDDYMLRKYDNTIFFESSMYERLGHGISRIGGTGIYIRSATLALATAILTDGITVTAANEDIRTVRSITGWKAWALRTIAEGAYSRDHPPMMMEEEKFVISHQEFMVISFWESMVSQCPMLTGKNYLDMSLQRSSTYGKRSNWDGVTEWVGMFSGSCEIKDRMTISRFLNENMSLSTWASTTGHVTSILTLRSPDLKHKRSLVVDLARFSTIQNGHVVAVAEATGLWTKQILPLHLRHVPDPDRDQTAEITDEGLKFEHEPMQYEFWFMRYCRVMTIILLLLIGFLAVVLGPRTGGLGTFLGVVIFLFFGILASWILYKIWARCYPWPWLDQCDVGEALFDNLLLHSLYDSGVKRQYRRLRGEFREIGWK